MSSRAGIRWRVWLPVLLVVPVCVAIWHAWLIPGNIAAWLLILSFCA
jgi:hypothetical protein